jgi:hypothetical protein
MTFGPGGTNPERYRGQPNQSFSSSDKLDFKQVLFMQLERIDDAASRAHEIPAAVSIRRFEDAVLALEDRLAPWDTTYTGFQTKVKDIKKNNKPYIVKYQDNFLGAVHEQNQELQKLMVRQKLLPAGHEKMYPEKPWENKKEEPKEEKA